MEFTVHHHRFSLTCTPGLVISLARKGRFPQLRGVASQTCKILWNKACRLVGLAV